MGCATFDDVSGCTVNWLGPCHVGSSKVCHIWFTSLAGSGLVCACNIMCWEHCKWWVTASSNCSSFQDVQWSQLCQAPAVLTRFCQGTFMISQYNCQYNCHTIRQSVFQPTVPQPLARPKKGIIGLSAIHNSCWTSRRGGFIPTRCIRHDGESSLVIMHLTHLTVTGLWMCHTSCVRMLRAFRTCHHGRCATALL